MINSNSIGVLFDLDGTILDTLTDLHSSVNYVLREAGMAERSVQEVRSFVGNGAKKLIESAVECGTSEQKMFEILAAFLAYYGEHNSDNTKPYEGVLEVVSALKKSGIKMGVVTNKPHKDAVPLVAKCFGDAFSVVLGQQDSTAKKPERDMMIIAQNMLEVGSVIYVGDSEVDVQFAQNSQVDCVAVSWGFRTKRELESAGATIIVESAEELMRILTTKLQIKCQ